MGFEIIGALHENQKIIIFFPLELILILVLDKVKYGFDGPFFAKDKQLLIFDCICTFHLDVVDILEFYSQYFDALQV